MTEILVMFAVYLWGFLCGWLSRNLEMRHEKTKPTTPVKPPKPEYYLSHKRIHELATFTPQNDFERDVQALAREYLETEYDLEEQRFIIRRQINEKN